MKTLIQMLVGTMVVASACTAQIVVEHDVDLWGGGVTNPSGLAAIPILQYDPSNGEMWIHTAGLNGERDSLSNFVIEGDDVGMNSISVQSPPAVETAPEFVGFQNGIVWNGQHFNGKQQIFTTGNGFHPPTQGVRIWTFDAGLTPDDFGVVEMSVFFGSGIRPVGGTMFGGVQFVPEPSGYLIVLSLALGLLFLRRIGK